MDAEPETLANSAVKSCAVVIAANRLKALPKSDDNRICEIGNSGDNAHGGYGRIAIGLCRYI